MDHLRDTFLSEDGRVVFPARAGFSLQSGYVKFGAAQVQGVRRRGVSDCLSYLRGRKGSRLPDLILRNGDRPTLRDGTRMADRERRGALAHITALMRRMLAVRSQGQTAAGVQRCPVATGRTSRTHSVAADGSSVESEFMDCPGETLRLPQQLEENSLVEPCDSSKP